MSTQNRRSSLPSSEKRHATENPGKVAPLGPHLPKKRPALANVTNQRQQPSSQKAPSNNSILVPCSARTASGKKGPSTRSNNAGFGGSILVPCSAKTVNVKKGPSTGINNAGFGVKKGPSSTIVKPTTCFPRNNVVVPRIAAPPASSRMDISPPSFDDLSVSMDETMSTCDSFNSPDVEYIDNNDITAVDSIERKTSSKLFISDHAETAGTICKRDILANMESDIIVDVDNDLMDPQLCATMACDIYKHLRASEAKKRPSIDFMERVQKDINPSMRAILIDWLVEVAEEYRLVPDTLYLTINYIDRYLSGNLMDRQRLQLLGVACMMIAAKYEEICAPQVEEFCYITDNTYFKEEVLQMESTILNFLKFEMTAPTARCFLRRFCRAAQGINEAPSLQLEYLANYLAELSLLEYNMLCYAPSLIAASAIFLAQYILSPSTRPWNSTLRHYTLYQPSDLSECVKALHSLCIENQSSSLPAIREKYSQHKHKFVAKKYCPPSIPSEYFENLSLQLAS